VALVAVSAGLHWAAWQTLEGPPVAAPVRVPAGLPAVPSPRASALVLTWVARATPEQAPRAAVTDGAAASARPSPARTVGSPTGSPASAQAPAFGPSEPSVPSGPPGPSEAAVPELAWLEVWEVDEPPQFLVAPDELDALAGVLGHPVRALVSLRIGSDGRLADIDVRAEGSDAASRGALLDALRSAFAGLAFLPARRDGRPVPVVQRWRLAIDPFVPLTLGLRPLD
jgi:hypothetical protein